MVPRGASIRRERRASEWSGIQDRVFDIAVIGGGITGASAFHELARRGFSVILLERGDFAGGTSQASAMIVWGGLLYLRHWDLATVRRLSAARDRMIDEQHGWVRARRFRYMPKPGAPLRGPVLQACLHFYWLLGGARRARPCWQRTWPEQAFLREGRLTESFLLEEAVLEPSDSRFILRMLLDRRGENRVPLNYCDLQGGGYDAAGRCWNLELRDALLESPASVRARCVVNASGAWTDIINDRFGRQTPYRHVLSKGVSVGLPRDPRQADPLVFDTERPGDSMVLIPWGPVCLWGSTETSVESPQEGLEPTQQDLRFLLAELNSNLATPIEPRQIVSVRTGVRSIASRRGGVAQSETLGMSRHPRVHLDDDKPWISVFGGKLTDSLLLGQEVSDAAERVLGRPARPMTSIEGASAEIEFDHFPALEDPVPSAQWCAENEMCWTLDDYLRRRTNIAQWVPRGGLGAASEHRPALLRLAGVFGTENGDSACRLLERYEACVREQFDNIVGACSDPRPRRE